MEQAELIRQTKVPGVSWTPWGTDRRVNGTLMFFSHDFLFQSEDGQLTEFLYKLVDTVLRVNERELLVVCKHFHVHQFAMNTRQDATNVGETILALAQFDDSRDFKAFNHRPDFIAPPVDKNNPFAEAEGWEMFDLAAQLTRMRVPPTEWRITNVNAEYKFCRSYPAKFAVPATIDDFFLEAVAQFRHRRRIPTLAYYYAATKTSIMRSGQPMIGSRQTRCFEDEKMLVAVVRNANKETPVSILDMRTKGNVTAAFGRGGGLEASERYNNSNVRLAHLEHPLLLREFFNKMLEVCRLPDVSTTQWLQETSGWLSQVQVCLSAGVGIAQAVVANGKSVLVHCEDDWDTATIAISLAKLMIDPYYRTYLGFQMLIEEDWLAFGFRFSERCAQVRSTSEATRKDVPYLALFVDAVFQMMEQFPMAMEFNELFVYKLYEHAHSCVFGTFLGNDDADRATMNVSKRSASYWSYVNSAKVKGPLVNRYYKAISGVLKVSAEPRSITFKQGFYNPWVRTSHLQILARNNGTDPLLNHLQAYWATLSTEVESILTEQHDAILAELAVSAATYFDPLGAVVA